MSGFDVTRADARRLRTLVIAASLGLSGALLYALLATGGREEPRLPDEVGPALIAAPAPQSEPLAETPVEPAAEPAPAETAPETPEPQETELAAAETQSEPFDFNAGFVAPQTPLVYRVGFAPGQVHQAAFSECLDCVQTYTHSLTVPRGGTLAGVLAEAGADRYDAGRAIASLRGTFDVRHFRAGQSVTVFTEDLPAGETGPDGDSRVALVGFSFRPDIDRAVTVAQTHGGEYRAREVQAQFRSEFVVASGSISSSLYADALQAGATDRVVVELAGVLAYAIDFQRSIRAGDEFDILFERFIDGEGDVARTGDILYARYDGRGDPLEFFRFETPDGIIGYYSASGESAQRLLMRTPINGARLSSHFGRRRHPILGYTRNHNGTDFAAPTGTPILAAGNGVVERANRFGSFGNYIRIRHANGYETAYAHLNGFARGVRSGTRVRQGQVIGYVGTTGRSTGPHLHYEVHHNGNPVNPMRLNLPTGRRLTAEEMPLFHAERDRIRTLTENSPDAAGEDLLMAQRNDPQTQGAR
jgi:murein DD-endopeptidase MepM/ murein hydrolase activator NlpD